MFNDLAGSKKFSRGESGEGMKYVDDIYASKEEIKIPENYSKESSSSEAR